MFLATQCFIRAFRLVFPCTLAFTLVFTELCAADSKQAKAANQSSQTSQNSPGSQASSSTPSGPFESQMLAYGSLDRVTKALADRTCSEIDNSKPSTILVLDQSSLSNLAAYDAFVATTNVLTTAFGGQPEVPAGPGGAAGPDVMADIVSAVSAVLVASNSETASNFTIQDPSAALKLTMYLKTNAGCSNSNIVYSNMIPTPAGQLDQIYGPLQTLADARADAFRNPPANILTNLDLTYNQFLQGLFTAGANGQPGIVPVLQGYNLRQLLNAKSGPVFSVIVNVAAAGGTQQVRKNLITALTTGEWIRYSGGVVVNTMIIRSDTNTLLFSDVLRYRSPLTTVHKPIHGKSTTYGDNLGDTCKIRSKDCPTP